MGVAFGCVGNTIRLRSGRYFDLSDPQPDQIEFSDIAGALSKICRFGGQIERFYSVAEHCYHCGLVAMHDGLSPDAIKAVLLHDATEAFVGDMVKPLKVMLPEYSEIELRVERAIEQKFDVDFAAHAEAVREIDFAMLIAERRAMFSVDDVQWTGEENARRLRVQFPCWNPPEAEAMLVIRARNAGIAVRGAGGIPE